MKVKKDGDLMAQYTTKIPANQEEFEWLVQFVESKILAGSMSASLEEKTFFELNGIKTVMMGFERYSYIGSNRVSLTVNLSCDGKNIMVVGFTTGGSQAAIFKINTIGEDTFLDKFKECIADFLELLGKKKQEQ